MPQKILNQTGPRTRSTAHVLGRLHPALIKLAEDGCAAERIFDDFVEPFIRDSAIYHPDENAGDRFGGWKPVSPSDIAPLRAWLHRELLTFGFLLELGFQGFCAVVGDDLSPVADAFHALMEGHARLGLVEGKPAIFELCIVPRAILTADKRDIPLFTGDPVNRLHAILRQIASEQGGCHEQEIAALIDQADGAFVAYAVESLRALEDMVWHPQHSSDNADRAYALVAAVKDRFLSKHR